MADMEKVKQFIEMIVEHHGELAGIARGGYQKGGQGMLVVGIDPAKHLGVAKELATIIYHPRAEAHRAMRAAGIELLPSAQETFWNFDPERIMLVQVVDMSTAEFTVDDIYTFEVALTPSFGQPPSVTIH